MSNDPYGFTKFLNSHGHAFQYSTLKMVHEASDNGKSGWIFEVSEFPVEVNNFSTRIDYILKWRDADFYLIVECKRANAAFCKWHFVKSPYVRRNASSHNELYAESLDYFYVNGGVFTSCARARQFPSAPAASFYDLCFELRGTKRKKDGAPEEEIVWESKGRGDIEDAAAQVTKGVNGFIEYYMGNPPMGLPEARAIFIPIIVTTADLYGVDTDLSASDIETGHVRTESVNVEEKRWVFLQHANSPSFRHSCQVIDPTDSEEPVSWPLDLGARLENEFIRTIPIVQGKHFGTFLNVFGKNLFDIHAPD